MLQSTAQDELDAAEKVIRSRAEIRQVLIDNDQSSSSISTLFGSGSPVKASTVADMYRDLDSSGSAMVMNIEMNQELAGGAAVAGSGGASKAKKGGSAGANVKKKEKDKGGATKKK